MLHQRWPNMVMRYSSSSALQSLIALGTEPGDLSAEQLLQMASKVINLFNNWE